MSYELRLFKQGKDVTDKVVPHATSNVPANNIPRVGEEIMLHSESYEVFRVRYEILDRPGIIGFIGQRVYVDASSK